MADSVQRRRFPHPPRSIQRVRPWRNHFFVLLIWACFGGIVTLHDLSSSGGWINLTGVVTFLYWSWFAAYVVVSSIVVALVGKRRWSLPIAHLLALLALPIGIWIHGQGKRVHRRIVHWRAASSLSMELPWRIVEEAEYFQLEVTVIPGHDGPLTLERFVGFTDKDAAAVIQLTSRTYSGRRGRRLKIEAHLRRTRPASPIIFYFHFTCANGLKITYWTREPREEYLERTADRGWRLRRKLPMPEHVQAKESEARRYYDARPPERRFPSPMQAAVFVTNRIVE